jgi:hypothetical protein
MGPGQPEYAPSGSDLERRSVATWSKHVEALPNAEERIDAARVAARYAPSGSEVARQARDKLRHLYTSQRTSGIFDKRCNVRRGNFSIFFARWSAERLLAAYITTPFSSI